MSELIYREDVQHVLNLVAVRDDLEELAPGEAVAVIRAAVAAIHSPAGALFARAQEED